MPRGRRLERSPGREEPLVSPGSKRRYFDERVAYWRRRLLIDPKITVQTRYQHAVREEEDHEEVSEALKLEELTVSTMERVLMGPDRWSEVVRVLSRSGGCFADCDCGEGQYMWFTITYYKDLLDLDDGDFRLMADRTALHETLHIALWPLTSYVENLESRV